MGLCMEHAGFWADLTESAKRHCLFVCLFVRDAPVLVLNLVLAVQLGMFMT